MDGIPSGHGGAWVLDVRIVSFHDLTFEKAIPPHRRTHGAIVGVSEGSGSIAVAAAGMGSIGEDTPPLINHRVSPSDVILFLPYEDHGYEPDPGSALRFTMVGFEVVEGSETAAFLPLLGTKRHFRSLGRSIDVVDSARRLYESNREFGVRAAEGFVTAILYQMIAQCDRRHALDRTSPVDRVMERLYTDYGARLVAIADALGVSQEAVRKEFRRNFGDSPMHYFTAYRVSLVARRLEDTDRPLRELAEEFGFYDEFHMSRLFKRQMGVSPSEYRARSRS